MPKIFKKLKGESEKQRTLNEPFRLPRPLGFTYTIIQYTKTQNKELIDILKKKTIQLYVNEDMKLNGKPITINQLAQYLNETPEFIMREMNREVERIANFFDGSEGKRLARVNWHQSLKKGLEIQALTSHQTAILMAQQGNNYVPFLTSEVNKSLANLINAQKPIHDLIRMLVDKNQINILLNTADTTHSGQHYLSPEQAMVMLNNVPSMLGNEAMIEAKEAELLALPDMPNVNARNQDLTKIGIRNVPIEAHPIPIKGTVNRHAEHHERVPNEVIDSADLTG